MFPATEMMVPFGLKCFFQNFLSPSWVMALIPSRVPLRSFPSGDPKWRCFSAISTFCLGSSSRERISWAESCFTAGNSSLGSMGFWMMSENRSRLLSRLRASVAPQIRKWLVPALQLRSRPMASIARESSLLPSLPAPLWIISESTFAMPAIPAGSFTYPEGTRIFTAADLT